MNDGALVLDGSASEPELFGGQFRIDRRPNGKIELCFTANGGARLRFELDVATAKSLGSTLMQMAGTPRLDLIGPGTRH